MKLLRQFESKIDAEQMSVRMRNKGVLTYISSKQSHSMSTNLTGAVKVGVWVVLENQYKDALSLLGNKRHEVKNPLTEEEMEALESATKESFSGSINGFLEIFSAYIFGGVIVAMMFFVLYSIVKNA